MADSNNNINTISNQPAPLDPSKYHVLTKQKKKLLILLFGLFVFGLTPLIGVNYYNFAINRPAQNAYEGQYVIPKGATVGSVAKELYSKGIINSEFLFKFYVRLNNLENKIQAGVYNIKAGSSIVEIANTFQRGTNDISITFIEGWRIEEMALLASKNFENVVYEDFVNYARPYEGYLFPDTYYFSIQTDAKTIVDKMRQTFDEKTQNLFTPENMAKQGLTKEQVMIFASILEREINNTNDLPIVAGILIKRFKDGELVGADATTQYMMANQQMCELAKLTWDNNYCEINFDLAQKVEWWPKGITQVALDTENEFNTRKVLGIPPTPISNSGISTIEAVINAVESNYYFYLSDNEGTTHFAETYEDHKKNIVKYL